MAAHDLCTCIALPLLSSKAARAVLVHTLFLYNRLPVVRQVLEKLCEESAISLADCKTFQLEQNSRKPVDTLPPRNGICIEGVDASS